MENWQRTFAYSTFIMVIGLAVIVFSETFVRFVQLPGWRGYTALFGYGIIYLNFSYVLTKRFVTKTSQFKEYAYILALLMVTGPIFWTFLKDLELMPYGQFLFAADITFASLTGAYFGIRRGLTKREEYVQRLKQEQVENDMKRPHDNINKN